jgi:hypothetical protein
MSKFSAQKPKGDAWGIEDVISSMTERILNGEKSPIVPFMGMFDIKEIKVDPETGDHEAVIRIRRMESITTIERIRKAQSMLLEQVAERRGEGTVLPFEEADIIARAFGGQPVGVTLQDDEEKSIDEGLTENDRLRRHLMAVHEFASNVLDSGVESAQVERWHEEEHAKDPADSTFPEHDVDSRMWRRVDLAEADQPNEVTPEELAAEEPDADGNVDGSRAGSPNESTDPDQAASDVPEAVFSEPVDPEAEQE